MIDCHFHLHESIIGLDALVASMDRFGVKKIALMASLNPPLEDTALARIGAPLFLRAITDGNKYLQKGARALYSSWVKKDGRVDAGGKLYEVKVQPRNDEVLEAVAARPDRFFGWIFVNPAGPVDPVSEIERCMEKEGIIGVKVHPFWHNYPTSMLADAAALCSEKGMPMIIHLGEGANGDFMSLIKDFPRLKIVFAHAGIPYQRDIWEVAREKENVNVDLASTHYVSARVVKMAVRRIGPDKCLFGSDGPYFHTHNDAFDYSTLIKNLDALALSGRDREKITRGNFLRLIG